MNTEENEQEIDYESDYMAKFSRKIPFPRLEIKNVIVNPVYPEYFYIRKVQAIDNSFVIKNYVLGEDEAKIDSQVNKLRDNVQELSDEDSEASDFIDIPKGRDYFEEAIEKMRLDKDYNVDEDGNTKTIAGISYVTRGTKASLVSNRSSQQDMEGGSTEDESGVSREASQSEADEEAPSDSQNYQESSSYPAEESGEGDNEGEGESEPDESEAEEVNKEHEDTLVVGTSRKPTKNNLKGSKSEPPNPNGQDVNKMLDMGMGILSMEEARKKLEADKLKIQEHPDEVDVDKEEEEEQFNWEELSFRHYEVENSGNTFKQKPEVLCCCKLEPFGYTIEQKLFCISTEADFDDFRFNDKPFFSSCGDFIGFFNKGIVAIYKSKTLELVHKYTIEPFENRSEFNLVENIMLSNRCYYLMIRTTEGTFVYDAKSGEQHHDADYLQEQYSCFINSNEAIGFGYVAETGASKITIYNARQKLTSTKVAFDKYFHSIVFNFDGRACTIEQDNTLYYADLDRDPKNLIKLLEGYDYIKLRNINRDSVSVIYSEESKIYIALYKKAKLIFRKKIDMAYYNFPLAIFATDDDKVIYVENTLKVFSVDESNMVDFEFEHKVFFHYPAIFYPYEKNEIWVQYVGKPNIINRFVFINTISSINLVDDVYNK